jgi:hypothetical protein
MTQGLGGKVSTVPISIVKCGFRLVGCLAHDERQGTGSQLGSRRWIQFVGGSDDRVEMSRISVCDPSIV